MDEVDSFQPVYVGEFPPGGTIAPRQASSEAWDAGDNRQKAVLTGIARRTAQDEELETSLLDNWRPIPPANSIPNRPFTNNPAPWTSPLPVLARSAEALDNYLTVVRRDHAIKYQIEERKIRDDAAYEEAKRKEKVMLEEITQQENMKAEAEEYRSHENHIARIIEAINGTNENVRSNAEELIKFFNSSCPQSISIAMFAEKVPISMEILLAELNKTCIFTVPKCIIYSESDFGSREDYQKALGYREEDGGIESTESYAGRLSSYMKLYETLVQAEVDGFQNLHGIKEGWTWLACLLSQSLPANYYTAVALQAFLEMAAGYALNRKYKGQPPFSLCIKGDGRSEGEKSSRDLAKLYRDQTVFGGARRTEPAKLFAIATTCSWL